MGIKRLMNGAPTAVRGFAFLLGAAAAVGYLIAAIVLLSDGVVKAKSGSCCMPEFCNPYALPASTITSWASGGMCLFPADQAAAMGCPNSESFPANCSVTNQYICKTQNAYGTILATGIIGIILAVFTGALLVGVFFHHWAFITLGAIALALTITQIVLAGIVFHWQLNDQHYTFQVARACSVKVKSNCVSYNYADWQYKQGICAIGGTHSFLLGWNVPPDSLVRPTAVMLFLPVAVIFFAVILFISAMLCPQELENVVAALENNAEPSGNELPQDANPRQDENNGVSIYGGEPVPAANNQQNVDIYGNPQQQPVVGEPCYPDTTKV